MRAAAPDTAKRNRNGPRRIQETEYRLLRNFVTWNVEGQVAIALDLLQLERVDYQLRAIGRYESRVDHDVPDIALCDQPVAARVQYRLYVRADRFILAQVN